MQVINLLLKHSSNAARSDLGHKLRPSYVPLKDSTVHTSKWYLKEWTLFKGPLHTVLRNNDHAGISCSAPPHLKTIRG